MKRSLQKREDGKYILQLLLPPHRGQLYVHHIETYLETTPSNHLKELVFNYLEENFSEEIYAESKRKDVRNWKEIIARRTEGRKKAKEAREQSE